MNEGKLMEVCFVLAENLMWDKDTTPFSKLQEDITQLSQMTNRFVEIAKRCYSQVEDLPEGEAILFGAVHYLSRQAFPSQRAEADYEWFNISLTTLLEICRPNVIIGIDGVPFLLSLQKGIIESLGSAIPGSEG